jgi:hypothetical protein
MKYFRLAIPMLSFVFSTFVFAQTNEIESLRNQYLGLKFENPADRKIGEEKLERVLDILAKFNAKSKKEQNKNKAEFANLVTLAAAALPYDQETECAESIEMVVSESPALKKVYEETLTTIQDTCRRQFLQTVVTERACYREAAKLERKEKTIDAANKCVVKPVFTYEGCLGIKIED